MNIAVVDSKSFAVELVFLVVLSHKMVTAIFVLTALCELEVESEEAVCFVWYLHLLHQHSIFKLALCDNSFFPEHSSYLQQSTIFRLFKLVD